MNFSKTNQDNTIYNRMGVTKHLILMIAAVVFSFLSMNATTLTTGVNTKTGVEITRDAIVKVYDWSVKTTTGDFSGTASTLFDAKRRANMVGQGVIVIEQKITSYYILKSELQSKASRTYFWEVKSKNGYAKGFSSTEFNAKRIMSLVTKGDIISYKIIEQKNK